MTAWTTMISSVPLLKGEHVIQSRALKVSQVPEPSEEHRWGHHLNGTHQRPSWNLLNWDQERETLFFSLRVQLSTYVSGATGSHSDRFVRQLEWDRGNPTNRGIRGSSLHSHSPHPTPPAPSTSRLGYTNQQSNLPFFFFFFINKFKLGFYPFQPNHLVFCFGLTIQLSGSYFPNQGFETRLPAVKVQES